jgi:hypothetical protein
MSLAAHIHDSRLAAKPIDRLGHETTVPGLARRLDTGFPVVPTGLGLTEDAFVGLGQRRIAEQVAGPRHAVLQIERRGGRPVPFEDRAHVGDRQGDVRHQGIAPLGIADRRPEDLFQVHGAVIQQHQHPGVEGARHHRGQQPGAGNEIEAGVPVGADGGGGGRGALAADDLHALAAGVVKDDRCLAPRPAQMGFHHLQGKAGGNGCIEGVSALLQDRHADRRRQPVG